MIYTALVVDDNPHLCELFSRAFERAGFNVTRVTSGRDALTFLRQKPADVMVLDIDMPGMSGLDVLHAISISEKIQRTRVIAATGSKQAYMNLGGQLADVVLVKPIGFWQMVSLAERLVNDLNQSKSVASPK